MVERRYTTVSDAEDDQYYLGGFYDREPESPDCGSVAATRQVVRAGGPVIGPLGPSGGWVPEAPDAVLG